jgi:O-methyltransferase involved in polyketide biosynthesis
MDVLKEEQKGYEKISPTAWIVAQARTLSDIPYSRDVFDELQIIMRQTRSAAELQELNKFTHPEVVPVMEARFKLVNRLVKENNAKQILELAAGFSPRGMELSKDPSVEYVEIDLPGVMNEKRTIVGNLIEQSKIPSRPNLHLEDGNALNLQDILKAIQPFKQESIAVVNEGLLTYLNFDEKAMVAKNVYQLLERFGGYWITPDLSLQPEGKAKEINIPLRQVTGINKDLIAFESETSAREFFEGLGFTVESHSFMEIMDEMASSKKLNFSDEQIIKILGPRVVFVMRVKK